jgi:hypothetical protein
LDVPHLGLVLGRHEVGEGALELHGVYESLSFIEALGGRQLEQSPGMSCPSSGVQ